MAQKKDQKKPFKVHVEKQEKYITSVALEISGRPMFIGKQRKEISEAYYRQKCRELAAFSRPQHEEAKKIYGMRKTIVEPVIGNIKYNLGFTKFLVRGLDGAKLELNITSIAHNLKKIWKVRGKICKNNTLIVFDLIVINTQMNCDSACLSSKYSALLLII